MTVVFDGVRRSEARFRALVENSSDGILLVTVAQAIEYASPSTTRILGYRPGQAIGWSIVDLVHEDDRAELDACWRAALVHPGKPILSVARIRHADGRWRYIEMIATSRFDDVAVEALVLNYRDITARRQAERELKAAKEAADAAHRAKSEFLANVSHEIRTPMNGILGMAQLAVEAESSEQQQEYLEHLKTAGSSLLVLIDEILDLSRMEAGGLKFEERPFAVRPLVQTSLSTIAAAAMAKGLSIDVYVPDNVPEAVIGDPARLRQVLVNLLGNAVKFTDFGGVSLNASVETTTDERVTLHFAVEDTGIGIPRDKQAAIFEPFTQADGSASRRYGGSGLGLTTCTHVVNTMGGRIWVESTVSAGSTFHFTATFGRVENIIVAAPPVAERAPQAAVECGPLSVLLVEDNAVNRLLASKLLEMDRHRVITAADGREALERIETDRFDVVLMDVQMPVMDGFEATAAIRGSETGTGRHQFIVALTAHALSGDRERCLQAGMDAYITKPVTRAELRSVLAQAADRRDRDSAEAPSGPAL